METDTWLKALALRHPQDLLRLVGDAHGTAAAAQILELQSIERRVDCVIEVRRAGTVHYRHIEFQAEAEPDMARRCFRYNTQLILQLEAPVITTVLYVFPPGPRETGLEFRVTVEGREVNVWRFEVVRLWEQEAEIALSSGAPGLLTLVPLMKGNTLDAIARADREISRVLPREQAVEAQSTLLHLAGYYYTGEDLERIFGRTKMIQSSVWRAAWAEGEAEGELQALRDLCREQVRKHHPSLLPRAEAAISACDDRARLKTWVLEATEHDHDAFARLLHL
jgi:predicted transposase YdaD